MRKIIELLKDYFIVSKYSSDEMAEFVRTGNLPEEFAVKRLRLRVLVGVVAFVCAIIYHLVM